MKVVISNKSKLGIGKVVVSNKNPIAKINFSKATTSTKHFPVSGLTDVVDLLKQDGAVLVYNASTNTYYVEILPNIDGGTF